MWNFLANFGKTFWETYQSYQSNQPIQLGESTQPSPGSLNLAKQTVSLSTYTSKPIIRRSRQMGSCTSIKDKPSQSKSSQVKSPRANQTKLSQVSQNKPSQAELTQPTQIKPSLVTQHKQPQVQSRQTKPQSTQVRIVQPTAVSMEFPMDYSRPVISPPPVILPQSAIMLQSTTMSQPVVSKPIPVSPQPNKTKRKAIPAKIREQVWQTYIGTDVGNCYACGRLIEKDIWHCSHVISDKRGGLPTLENLRPCCVHCNLQCRDKNLYAFIRDTGRKGEGARYCDEYLRLHPEQALIR